MENLATVPNPPRKDCRNDQVVPSTGPVVYQRYQGTIQHKTAGDLELIHRSMAQEELRIIEHQNYNEKNTALNVVSTAPVSSYGSETLKNSDGTDVLDPNGNVVSLSRFLQTKPLKTDISTRPGPGNRQLSYLSGDCVTRTLNEAFGFDGWCLDIKCTNREECTKDEKGRWRVTYTATVRVTHRRSGTYKEDCGAGDSIDRCLGTAISHAIKASVTDAMKRAARHFGEKLGNTLYSSNFNIRKAPSSLADALNRHDDELLKARSGCRVANKLEITQKNLLLESDAASPENVTSVKPKELVEQGSSGVTVQRNSNQRHELHELPLSSSTLRKSGLLTNARSDCSSGNQCNQTVHNQGETHKQNEINLRQKQQDLPAEANSVSNTLTSANNNLNLQRPQTPAPGLGSFKNLPSHTTSMCKDLPDFDQAAQHQKENTANSSIPTFNTKGINLNSFAAKRRNSDNERCAVEGSHMATNLGEFSSVNEIANSRQLPLGSDTNSEKRRKTISKNPYQKDDPFADASFDAILAGGPVFAG